MIHIISDRSYREYQLLKAHYDRDTIAKSIGSVTNLEQDVDEPIKTCVMGFSLLGCNPIWSCCGFDYDGQPIHKRHRYGCEYFILEYNLRTSSILERFNQSITPFKEHWKMNTFNRDGMIVCSLQNEFEKGWLWQDRNHPHFSELAATYTGYL